jgi:hypothetical protein
MRSLLRRLALFTLLVFVLVIDQAYGVVAVNPGWDLLQTTPVTTFGGVPFLGVPLGTFDFGVPVGVKPTFTTDTIVQRKAAAIPPGVPGTAPAIPIELVALQLESTAPTDFGLGPDFYFITLQKVRGGPASVGLMTIDFATANTGTFSSFFDVFFDVRKGSLVGPIAVSSDLVLSNSGAGWQQVPPPGSVVIDGVNHNLNGVDTTNDFWPGPIVETHPTGAMHSAVGATINPIPEPGTLLLVLCAGLALILNSRQFFPQKREKIV